MPKNRKMNLLLTGLIVALVAVVCVAGYLLLRDYQESAENDQLLAEMQAIKSSLPNLPEPTSIPAPTQAPAPSPTPTPAPKVIMEQYAELAAMYPHFVGWVRIPGSEFVDYPVAQGENNDDLLAVDIALKKSKYGNILMDYRNDPEELDQNTILYGHNMKNGKMFGQLKLYKDKKYFDEHPAIYFDTKYESHRFDIFSVYFMFPKDQFYSSREFYRIRFREDHPFDAYLSTIKEMSLYDCGVEVTAEDQIITLYTCANNVQEGARFIVHGVLSEDG